MFVWPSTLVVDVLGGILVQTARYIYVHVTHTTVMAVFEAAPCA